MTHFLFEGKSPPVDYPIGKSPVHGKPWSTLQGYYRPDPPPGPTLQEMGQGCTALGCLLFFLGICLVLCAGVPLLLLL